MFTCDDLFLFLRLCENEVCLCKPLGVLSLQWCVNCTPERVMTVSVANYKKTTLVLFLLVLLLVFVGQLSTYS